MPTKKRKVHKSKVKATTRKTPAAIKYQASRYPTKIREAAAEFALARRARKKIGTLALGKPKSSKVHKDYKAVDRAYQATGKKLAKLTNFHWKTKRK
jgi:hypothetical protein